MSFKCFYLLILCLGISLDLVAQDTLERVEVRPADAKMRRQERSYLDTGHYEKMKFMQVLPKADTAAYGGMKGRYNSSDFIYDEVDPDAESMLQRAIMRIKQWLSNLLPNSSLFTASETVYKILAGIAILIFLLILYKLLFSGKRLLGPSDEEEDGEDTIRFIEKNLLDIDLTDFINKAKQEEDYALAIRYLNLLNIQLLATKGYILWKPSKTNQELIGELRDAELRADFTRNVAVFDRVWFSGLAVDKAAYATYADYFLQFQSKWK